MSDTYNAVNHELTREFLEELIALCEKHGKVVVPTYQGEVSFHDGMRVIPMDAMAHAFLLNTSVDPEGFARGAD